MSKYSKSLKIVLGSVMVLTVGMIVLIFATHHRIIPEQPTGSKNADVALGKVQQTSTRNGIKEWTLEAESADFSDALKQANFKQISAVFFLKSGQEVHLTAHQGVLKTESKDIELTGDVVIKSDHYLMKSDALRYEHERHRLLSTVPITVEGSDFQMSADAMSFDLNTNRAMFQGNVKGMLNEKDVF